MKKGTQIKIDLIEDAIELRVLNNNPTLKFKKWLFIQGFFEIKRGAKSVFVVENTRINYEDLIRKLKAREWEATFLGIDQKNDFIKKAISEVFAKNTALNNKFRLSIEDYTKLFNNEISSEDEFFYLFYSSEGEIEDFAQKIVQNIHSRVNTLLSKYKKEDLFPLEGFNVIDKVKRTKPKPKSKSKPRLKIEVPLSGILTLDQIANRKFEPLAIGEPWNKLIGHFELPIQILIHGKGGRGKTSTAFLLAKEFSRLGKKVLFASKEQYYSPTLRSLLSQMNIDTKDKNIAVYSEYESEYGTPNDYDLVVLDSKDSFGIKAPSDFEKLVQKYPKTSFIVLSQSTKDDEFRGAGNWQNVVDTMLHLYDYGKIRTGEKNRWGAFSEVTLFEKKDGKEN